MTGEFVAEADERSLEQIVAKSCAQESERPVEVVVVGPGNCFRRGEVLREENLLPEIKAVGDAANPAEGCEFEKTRQPRTPWAFGHESFSLPI